MSVMDNFFVANWLLIMETGVTALILLIADLWFPKLIRDIAVTFFGAILAVSLFTLVAIFPWASLEPQILDAIWRLIATLIVVVGMLGSMKYWNTNNLNANDYSLYLARVAYPLVTMVAIIYLVVG